MWDWLEMNGAIIGWVVAAVALVLLAVVLVSVRKKNKAPGLAVWVLVFFLVAGLTCGAWATFFSPQPGDGRLSFRQQGKACTIQFSLGQTLQEAQSLLDAKNVVSDAQKYETHFNTVTVNNDDGSYYIMVFEDNALARVDQYQNGQLNVVMGQDALE